MLLFTFFGRPSRGIFISLLFGGFVKKIYPITEGNVFVMLFIQRRFLVKFDLSVSFSCSIGREKVCFWAEAFQFVLSWIYFFYHNLFSRGKKWWSSWLIQVLIRFANMYPTFDAEGYLRVITTLTFLCLLDCNLFTPLLTSHGGLSSMEKIHIPSSPLLFL